MRRVVITGMGAVSSIGNNVSEVTESLKNARSGIQYQGAYRAKGLRCQVAGSIQNLDCSEHIPRKLYRFMGDAAAYGYIASQEAIKQSGLDVSLISNPRTGLVMGSGGASTEDIVVASELLDRRGVRKIGPYRVTSTMASTMSACLATAFGIKGMNVSMSSACSTSAHCIGYGMELIQWGKQDIVLVGGGEAEHWSMSCLFDAMGAFSTQYNDQPEKASRAYDQHRDGFVIAGGAGTLVLEEREHALKRGANILGELVGYGTASDGCDMVSPSGEGAENAMRMAVFTVDEPIDYLNTHGTSTPVGDIVELTATENVFGNRFPLFSSTKSLTGHSLGAAGVHEAIYSLIMLNEHFITPSANIESLDNSIAENSMLREKIVLQKINKHLKTVMSNSFGFGGTNVSLVFQKS